MKTKLIISLLTAALLLSACGRKAEDAPADSSVPTMAPAVTEEVTPEPTVTEEVTPEPAVTEAAQDSKNDEAETERTAPDPDSPEDSDDDEDPDLDDPALRDSSGEGDGTVQDPSEVDDDLPDYLRDGFEPTASDGSGGVGEGAVHTAGSIFEVPKDLTLNPYPSDPVIVESGKGNYSVAVTAAKKVQAAGGNACLEISFSFANESVSSQILIDTLNLTLVDETGLVLQTVAEDNPSLATLEPAAVGDSRSFTIKYYLPGGANTARMIYTDLNTGKMVGWEIGLKKL